MTNGTATLTTSSLAAGGHSFQAVYLGNFNFNASTSSSVSQSVAVDVTSQFDITLGAIKKKEGKFTQIDTFQNTGGTLLSPIDLVLQGLSSKAKLAGAGKTTTYFPGSPFIVITGGALVHGQSTPSPWSSPPSPRGCSPTDRTHARRRRPP